MAESKNWDIIRVAFPMCDRFDDDQVINETIETFETDGWEYIGEDQRELDCFLAFKKRARPGSKKITRQKREWQENIVQGIGKKGSTKRQAKDKERTDDWGGWWEE